MRNMSKGHRVLCVEHLVHDRSCGRIRQLSRQISPKQRSSSHSSPSPSPNPKSSKFCWAELGNAAPLRLRRANAIFTLNLTIERAACNALGIEIRASCNCGLTVKLGEIRWKLAAIDGRAELTIARGCVEAAAWIAWIA